MLLKQLISFLLPIGLMKLGFDSGGGGGGSNTTTATTMNYSPEEAKRRTKVMDKALDIYNNGSDTQAYPGQVPTGPSAETTSAQNYLKNLATNFSSWMQPVSTAFQSGLSATDVHNNTDLAGAVQAAINPITQAYSGPGGALGQIRTGANENGQFGGSRQGIAEGIAAGNYMRQVGDTSAKMYSDAYEKGLDTMVKSLSMAPEMANMSTLPANWEGSVGASKEAYDANTAAYDAASKEWSMNYPWLRLQNLANLVYGSGSMGGTTTSTGPGYQSNPLMTALGAASMGASLYNNVAPWLSSGSAAGAGASIVGGDALYSALASPVVNYGAGLTMSELGPLALAEFSDRRLKRNIKRIGTTPKGIPLYEFEYLWSSNKRVGVMADEAPVEAVIMHPSGFAMVDYSKIN